MALYLLAAVEARRGATDAALSYLGQTIEISPEARAQARYDADFEPLRNLHGLPGDGGSSQAVRGLTRPATASPRARPDRFGHNQQMSALHVVILAAGKGTRMKSRAAEGPARAGRAARSSSTCCARSIAFRRVDDRLVVGHGADERARRAGRAARSCSSSSSRRNSARATRSCRRNRRWRARRGTRAAALRRRAAAAAEHADAPGRDPPHRTRRGHGADRRTRRSVRLRPHRPRRRPGRSRASSKSATRRPRSARFAKSTAASTRFALGPLFDGAARARRPTTRRASTT